METIEGSLKLKNISPQNIKKLREIFQFNSEYETTDWMTLKYFLIYCTVWDGDSGYDKCRTQVNKISSFDIFLEEIKKNGI